MTWLIGTVLDSTPWWVWALAAFAALAATYQLWAPLWVLIPQPLRLALAAVAAALLAYLAGRNKGASGALERARQKDTANAARIVDKADRVRADADVLNAGGGLRDDDGWRRKD